MTTEEENNDIDRCLTCANYFVCAQEPLMPTPQDMHINRCGQLPCYSKAYCFSLRDCGDCIIVQRAKKHKLRVYANSTEYLRMATEAV